MSEETNCYCKFLSMSMESGTEMRLYKKGNWHLNDWNIMILKI